MKKGWKIFLGICGGVAVLGLGLAVTGKAMGTDFTDLSSSLRSRLNNNIRSGTIVDYDWDDEDDWDFDWDDEHHSDNTVNNNESAQDDNTSQSQDSATTQESNSTSGISGKEYQAIQSVEIEIGGGEVVIEPYNGTSVVVDDSGVLNPQRLSIRTDEEELEIQWNQSVRTTSPGTLKIYLPEKGISELSANIGTGALEINGVTVNDIDVDLGAGQADIAVDVLMEADFDCGAGQMNVILPGTEKDYNYNLKCGIGRIQVGTMAYEGLANKTNVNNNAMQDIDIDCGVGEVIVSFK